MNIKNSIKITVLRTINTIYDLSRVVTVCFIKKEMLCNYSLKKVASNDAEIKR
jgi:hypothetical protein